MFLMEKRCPISLEGSSTTPSSVKNMYEKTITIAKGNSSLGKVANVFCNLFRNMTVCFSHMFPVLLVKTKYFPFSGESMTGYSFFAALALFGCDGSGSICCHAEHKSKVSSLAENSFFPVQEFSHS